MRRWLLVLCGLTVLGGALSGCVAASSQPEAGATSIVEGDGSSTVDAPSLPTPGSPPVAGPGQPSCSLAPASLVEATLGISLSEPKTYILAQGIECGYAPLDPDDSSILLRFLTGQDHATFLSYRADDTSGDSGTSDLAGVGDEAYFTSTDFSSPTTHTVVARKGSVIVVASAGAELAGVQSLVASIVATLA